MVALPVVVLVVAMQSAGRVDVHVPSLSRSITESLLIKLSSCRVALIIRWPFSMKTFSLSAGGLLKLAVATVWLA